MEIPNDILKYIISFLPIKNRFTYDDHGWSELHKAVFNGRYIVVSKIGKYFYLGEHETLQDFDNFNTPAHIACMKSNIITYYEIIGFFPKLEHIKNKQGKVPLDLLPQSPVGYPSFFPVTF